MHSVVLKNKDPDPDCNQDRNPDHMIQIIFAPCKPGIIRPNKLTL